MMNTTAKIAQVVENTVLGQVIVFAHELGIFKAISECTNNGQPASTEIIAKKCGYKQRYVQELLCCLACGDILEMNVTGDAFRMNRNTEEFMTAAEPPHVFGILKMVLQFPDIFDDLKKVFQNNGPLGLGYHNYKNSHRCLGSSVETRFKNPFFSCFLPFTGLEKKLQTESMKILNVACGTADQIIELAKRFSSSQFVGVDTNNDTIQIAKANLKKQNVTNVELLITRDNNLPSGWTGRFDWVALFKPCHEFQRPDQCLHAVSRVLQPDGVLTMIDANGIGNAYLDKICQKSNATIGYGISLFRCLPISSNSYDAYCLGMMWGQKKALALLQKCGFGDVKVTLLPFSGAEIVYVCKKKQRLQVSGASSLQTK